jgi:hypothetical protein
VRTGLGERKKRHALLVAAVVEAANRLEKDKKPRRGEGAVPVFVSSGQIGAHEDFSVAVHAGDALPDDPAQLVHTQGGRHVHLFRRGEKAFQGRSEGEGASAVGAQGVEDADAPLDGQIRHGEARLPEGHVASVQIADGHGDHLGKKLVCLRHVCGAGLIRPVPEGTGESRRWFPKGRSSLREYSRNDAKGAVLLRENVARGLPVAAARLEKAKGFHLLLRYADFFFVLLAGFLRPVLAEREKEKNKTDNGSPCKILKEDFSGKRKERVSRGHFAAFLVQMPKESNKERGERGGFATMKTNKFTLRFVAAATMVLLLAGAAWCADVALTSVGQSPDATMVKVVLKKLKVENDHDNLFTPEKLAGQKVLLAVVGGSSKGLGAAGIDKDQEKARAVGLIEAAKEKE